MHTTSVNLRSQLKQAIADFLKREDMCCPHTEEGLIELVVALSHYTEEGARLFPQVVLCDDLTTTLGLLQCSDPLTIGIGPRDDSAIKSALKRCAPLAQDGWVIYILRLPEKFEYGVFRSPPSPTALDIQDTVRELGHQTGDMHIIVMSQLAEQVVELVGAASGAVHVYLSAIPDTTESPQHALESLVSACCVDVPPAKREQVHSFLRSSLSVGVRRCHGTLIGVLPENHEPASITTDGIVFKSAILLSVLVQEHELHRTDHTLAALTAYSSLLTGMLCSDGVVLLGSSATLIGYNLFVKPLEKYDNGTARVVGGARRRAFRKLCSCVDEGQLRGCFFRSSDGALEYYDGKGKQ